MMRVRQLPAVLAAGAALLSGALPAAAVLPYRSAGLTAEEAAAFLLDRFTFGPRPGDVDRVVELGLEAWLEIQLASDLPEPELEAAVADLQALDLPPDEMAETLRAAVRDEDRGAVRRLIGDLLAWKLYRAVLAENQLREVMTDFWLEHLYVSLTDPQTRPFVLSYERDAIRPHALGSFPELLRASARHPAMLVYLDNAVSTAEPGTRTTLEGELDRLRRRGRGRVGLPGRRPTGRDDQGLNENYARELLELHTLGVDGGYTEQDVQEVARAFTGWSMLPLGARGEAVARRLERAGRLGGLGFVLDGGFLFRADAHDAEPKTVLGVELPAGRGVEDGEAVLRLLGRHPATARHVARALAVRFVSDDPPASLVDRLAASYRETGGEVQAILVTLVGSEEFWAEALSRDKVKSPFELAVSSLRALDARVERPSGVFRAVAAMGQRPYAFPAPTGYPETADGRLGSGTLLERLAFATTLAMGRVPGVDYDPRAVVAGTPGSGPHDLLRAALEILLPGRRLTPDAFADAGSPPSDPREALALVLSSPDYQVR